jgi:hypothetical protein
MNRRNIVLAAIAAFVLLAGGGGGFGEGVSWAKGF